MSHNSTHIMSLKSFSLPYSLLFQSARFKSKERITNKTWTFRKSYELHQCFIKLLTLLIYRHTKRKYFNVRHWEPSQSKWCSFPNRWTSHYVFMHMYYVQFHFIMIINVKQCLIPWHVIVNNTYVHFILINSASHASHLIFCVCIGSFNSLHSY